MLVAASGGRFGVGSGEGTTRSGGGAINGRDLDEGMSRRSRCKTIARTNSRSIGEVREKTIECVRVTWGTSLRAGAATHMRARFVFRISIATALFASCAIRAARTASHLLARRVLT
ncbi:MAG TPA: hypothetical protein VGF94_25135 [Kofleriaceae bacterium]|jgi:hypothetical protein